MTIWHWLAGLAVLILLTRTRGAARGGIVILLVTFGVARVLYLLATTGHVW